MAFHPEQIELACQHLSKRDRRMRRVIESVGPFSLKPQRDYFRILVRSIVSQQISTAAARTILARINDHLLPEKITPASFARLDFETLRSLGLSPQKAGYALDLTDKVTSGQLNLRTIARRDDETVIAELTQVKGIGVWSAHMFLIFALGRLDVLPVGDLGIRNAIQRLYSLPEVPKPAEVHAIAEPWRPYASVASWYLWRSLDEKA